MGPKETSSCEKFMGFDSVTITIQEGFHLKISKSVKTNREDPPEVKGGFDMIILILFKR